jgi:N-sulfoglucosamine sulfohydrolase
MYRNKGKNRHVLNGLIALISALISSLSFAEKNKPNILWIFSEDNSSHWIGSYGNDQAKTPRVDALAKEGILFENAYSNAPVCAVARATVLTGVYSPTLGAQHMRSRHPIPEKYRPNVEYLRAAGYYCTNRRKTDYNFAGDDDSYWDDSSGTGHYKNRPEGKPFYAFVSVAVSHESSLFKNKPLEPKRLKPEEIDLPPYLPDLPEIRKDYARYHDRITDMDTQIGQLLDQLEREGLAEDTIVIYSSDHGGILPRGKRYLNETGVKVPMIIRIPKKFQHLSPFKPGERVTEPISFVDFSPTLLSLAGTEIPGQMQGRALLGKSRVEPASDEMELLYADRFDEYYGMRRGLTDGKWKYIRNFNPHLPLAPYSSYQFGQPGWGAYKKAFEEGKLKPEYSAIWKAPEISEQLFDLSADPWETKNLATDPAHSKKLIAMRNRLKETMRQATDTGLVPEPLFDDLADGATIADYVQSENFDMNAVLDLAFVASSQNPANLPLFKEKLASPDPVQRYWAAMGLVALGEKSESAADALMPILEDQHTVIRTVAAEAFMKWGKADVAEKSFLTSVTEETQVYSLLHLFNTLRRYDLLGKVPEDWKKGKNLKSGDLHYINKMLSNINGYPKRL